MYADANNVFVCSLGVSSIIVKGAWNKTLFDAGYLPTQKVYYCPSIPLPDGQHNNWFYTYGAIFRDVSFGWNANGMLKVKKALKPSFQFFAGCNWRDTKPVYPRGKVFPFSFYFTGGGTGGRKGAKLPDPQRDADQKKILNGGATMVGPQYELNFAAPAVAAKYKKAAAKAVSEIPDELQVVTVIFSFSPPPREKSKYRF